MRLLINNIAKIRNAELKLDGITVIAGENGTGKSTVGKSLFCLFNSLDHSEEKIEKEKIDVITSTLAKCMRRLEDEKSRDSFYNTDFRTFRFRLRTRLRSLAGKVMEQYKDDPSIDVDEVSRLCMRCFAEAGYLEKPDEHLGWFEDTAKQIWDLLNIDNSAVLTGVVNRYVHLVFCDQVNHLSCPEAPGTICAVVKNKEVRMEFANQKCVNIKEEIRLDNKVICVGNPSIVSEISNSGLRVYQDDHSMAVCSPDDYLRASLENGLKANSYESVIREAVSRQKIKEALELFNATVRATVVVSEDGFKLREKTNGADIDVDFSNISMGIRAFLIMKMLLERGMLNQKDVLVLDEPEIHLHPDWQVRFAQAIVVLQKALDLTVLITTHSSFFVDAIDLYTRKYCMADKVNFYIAEMVDDRTTFREVTQCQERMYDKMASAVQKLDDLRESLELEGK